MHYDWLLKGFLQKKRISKLGPFTKPIQEIILANLSRGVVLLDNNGCVIWFNEYLYKILGEKIKKDLKIDRFVPGFNFKEVRGKKEHTQFIYDVRKIYLIKSKQFHDNNKIYYILTYEDITKQFQFFKKALGNYGVIALVQIDNLREVIKTVTEEEKPYILGAVEKSLTDWINSIEGYLKQTSEGQYLAVIPETAFKYEEKKNFSILEKMRSINLGNSMPLTVSIGIGIEEENLNELGILAQNALELALERGGDQVVVKSPEKTWFFGGKSAALEKRTKVKVRVMANALQDMIHQASHVIVMGHDMADYDSLGACLGMAKAAKDLGKRVWVVIDRDNPTVSKILDMVQGKGEQDVFLKQGEGLAKIDDKTLLIIVDTHKPSLLADPTLLDKAKQIAVIDHHRRGEEHIPHAQLVYIESYASSSCELVTELLQYFGNKVEIGKLEATLLLAGIIVDTKHFMFQTGVRTFEAASYLRSLGGESSFIQEMLRDDFATVIKKTEVMKNAKLLFGQIALAVSQEESPEAQVLAAKTADTMLNIAGVKASFVLWPYKVGIAVSGRSNGDINVQTIMEKLGGGGHLTSAAAQLTGSVDNIKQKLIEILEEEFGEEV